jgi:hypothetical protein
MANVELRADCARCSGLCCVAMAFDRSALFGFDKPAGTPCRHLTAADRCGIHVELTETGFAGCAAYDCLGAGQRVTEMFGDRSWRESPTLARDIFEAFRIMRRVHEALELLRTAATLPLTPAQSLRRGALEATLDRRWTFPALKMFDRGPVLAEVRTFLASLAPHLAGLRLHRSAKNV